jgi:hypothetical protein
MRYAAMSEGLNVARPEGWEVGGYPIPGVLEKGFGFA